MRKDVEKHAHQPNDRNEGRGRDYAENKGEVRRKNEERFRIVCALLGAATCNTIQRYIRNNHSRPYPRTTDKGR